MFEQFIAENAKFSAQQNLRRKAQMVAMMKLSNFDAYFAAALASINPEGQSPSEMGVSFAGARTERGSPLPLFEQLPTWLPLRERPDSSAEKRLCQGFGGEQDSVRRIRERKVG